LSSSPFSAVILAFPFADFLLTPALVLAFRGRLLDPDVDASLSSAVESPATRLAISPNLLNGLKTTFEILKSEPDDLRSRKRYETSREAQSALQELFTERYAALCSWTSQPISLLDLPDELLCRIAGTAGLRASSRLATTCKRLWHVVNDDTTWKHMLDTSEYDSPQEIPCTQVKETIKKHYCAKCDRIVSKDMMF
jgi:hypothetical protein